MGLLGGFTAIVVVLLIIPIYSDYRSRAESSEYLLGVGGIKSAVADNIVRLKSVTHSGAGVKVPTNLRFDPNVTIRDDGVIIVHGKKHGQLLVLIPDFTGGKVAWTFVGGSAKDVPPFCRAR